MNELFQFLRGYGNAPFHRAAIPGKSEFLCNSRLPACFLILGENALVQEKISFHLKDMHGKQYRVEAQRLGSNSLEVDFSTLTPHEGNKADTSLLAKSLRRRFATDKLSKLDEEKLARYLTDQQLASSRNAGSGGEDFRNGIERANAILAAALKRQEPITMEKLEQINWFATRGIELPGNGIADPLAGVVRGTNYRLAPVQDELKLINAEGAESYQGLAGTTANAFLPSREVPAALSKLINRINQIGPNSDPTEIFAVFKEFILIHPFVDANGRTGRMLLNYMLIKAGLPPSPTASESLYFTPEELFEQYARKVKSAP